MTLLNVYNFFYQYVTLDKWTPDQQPQEVSLLDKWILSKLNQTLVDITENLDNFDAYSACIEIDRFVNILSKWYVRRSRRRFWKTEADDEKKAAYSTLYKCLKTVYHMMAPIIPHLSEALYQRMIKPEEPELPESIHHCRWPEPDLQMIDKQLMAEMDLAMNLSSLGRAARNQENIKLRQPLREAVVVVSEEDLERLDKVSDLVKEELNVKELKVTTNRSLLQSLAAIPIPAKLGRKHGRLFPMVNNAIKNLSSSEARKLLNGKAVTMMVEGKSFRVLPEEVELEYVSLENYSVVEQYNLLVGVNTNISKDLESEGLARDLVRRIQALRKEADFDIDDQIITYYEGDQEIEIVFQEESAYIKEETLSDDLKHKKAPLEAIVQEYEIDGQWVKLGVLKK
jgi:isoleucyl-tRNA synthetase